MQTNKTVLLSIAMITLLAVGGIYYFGGGRQDSAHDSVRPSFIDAYRATEGAVLLDVRTPGEFASGHIENAQNVDFYAPDFSTKLAALDRNAPYFVYCRSGNRSGQTVELMQQLGFTNVTDLPGGIASAPTLLQ